jgi:rRNA-processing protein FCF1
MRVLLDTNIFIYTEDNTMIKPNAARAFKLSQQYGIPLFIHKKSIEDIKRDKDLSIRNIMLSKITKYPELDFYVSPDSSFIKIVGGGVKPNDNVDNYLLYALARDSIKFLITEDVGIKNKAKRLGVGLANRVLSTDEYVAFLEENYQKSSVANVEINEVGLASLDLNDLIFDTLKKSYPNFEEWFRISARNGRSAWVYYSPLGEILGLVVFKDEGPRLKLCTFKMSKLAPKYLGELFLDHAFRHALINNYKKI